MNLTLEEFTSSHRGCVECGIPAGYGKSPMLFKWENIQCDKVHPVSKEILDSYLSFALCLPCLRKILSIAEKFCEENKREKYNQFNPDMSDPWGYKKEAAERNEKSNCNGRDD